MSGCSTRRVKQVLASLLAIGAAASLSVSGTEAILTSQETNAGSTVASGTLTLGNQVDSGTICYSYAGPSSPGNQNGGCDALFSASSQNYPGGSTTARVTITDAGSIGVGDLTVYMPSCVAQATPGAGSLAGGGDPCSYVTDGSGTPDGPLLSIEETDSSGNPLFCWYPDDASGACSSTFSQDDWLGIFAQYVNTPALALDLGAGPAAGQSRYFDISVGLPANADPSLQGEEGLFSLTWHATT